MAFWGVEVKPSNPITHSCEKARRRLRISQATLGFGEASNKSVVQCNVGNRRPILLCVLLPGQTESSHLDLEFEEADDVVFSVIGPRSVYLTGYYVRQNQQSNSRSDTESYGVDIENTQTDGSNYSSDDDRYGGSFINDDELQFSPGSPVLCGDKGMDEITLEKDKRKARKGRSKLLKKKHRVIKSDNAVNSPKKEDEDGLCLSLHESEGDVKTTACDTGEKIAQVTVEMDDEANETMQNVDPLDIGDKIERVAQLPLDEEGTEVNNGKNELPKQGGSSEEIIVSNQEEIHGSNTSETCINLNLPMIKWEDQKQSLVLEKPKKKRKERPLTDKTSEAQTDNEDPSVPTEHKELEIDTSADMEIGMVAPELDSASGQKSKKRRNELLEGELTQGTDEEIQNITEEDLFKQGSLHADGVTGHLPGANVEYEQQKAEESIMEKFGVECCNVQKEDEVMQEAHADSKIKDLPEANGENQNDQIDSNISTKSEFQANDSQLGTKIKEKRKKTQGKKDLNMSAIQMSANQENEDQSTKTVPIDTRTLSNGLTIEELRSGPPGGKVAVPGKTVKIYYTGMLKEGGHVFDTNVGKVSFKFRLGDEDYIDGWNVGIDGMRVGDKRRLIIPPSMGFGEEGSTERVPPNTWIIYDIELVSVRR